MDNATGLSGGPAVPTGRRGREATRGRSIRDRIVSRVRMQASASNGVLCAQLYRHDVVSCRCATRPVLRTRPGHPRTPEPADAPVVQNIGASPVIRRHAESCPRWRARCPVSRKETASRTVGRPSLSRGFGFGLAIFSGCIRPQTSGDLLVLGTMSCPAGIITSQSVCRESTGASEDACST